MILVQPQMGENIGAAARIMSNFGLEDLRIVAPRDGWPNPKAEETARNARFIIDKARVFPSLRESAYDTQRLFAATARPRDMVKPSFTPRQAAAEYASYPHSGLVFGPERSGLTNEDISLCEAVITVPVDPAHASLNLAQAVAILCYEWFIAGEEGKDISSPNVTYATKAEITGFFDHLEGALDRADYFKAPEKRERMLVNLRNMFLRAEMTDQDVRTLRGILTILEKRP